VTAMAQDLGCSVKDLIDDSSLHNAIDLKKYVTEQAGMPTLVDIMAELAKPGRDPRAQFESMDFAEGIQDMADLEKGMKLPGVVTNVTAFGAFVDVGVHQDGLVHISQLADRFIKNPAEVVKVNQRVDVTVLDVDLDRKRISLSMRKDPGERRTSGNGGKKAKPMKKQVRKSKEPKNKPFNNPFINALK